MRHLLLVFFLLVCLSAKAQLDTVEINSQHLGRTIRSYIWQAPGQSGKTPHIYATDGQKMIDYQMLERIEQLTKRGDIPKATYILVSTKDPVSGHDLRNKFFFCNPNYLLFFEEELIPAVEAQLQVKARPEDRSLIGISFGAMNAAYFTASAQPLFRNYALLSPITYPCSSLADLIVASPEVQQRVFLSTGKNDAEQYLRKLKNWFGNKGYELEILKTKGRHDFSNWNLQLRQVINFLLDAGEE